MSLPRAGFPELVPFDECAIASPSALTLHVLEEGFVRLVCSSLCSAGTHRDDEITHILDDGSLRVILELRLFDIQHASTSVGPRRSSRHDLLRFIGGAASAATPVGASNNASITALQL